MTTRVASPTKKSFFFCWIRDQIDICKHLYLCFFPRRMFRNSATTPAIELLIPKSSALQKNLWCTHCSVAKRQQFSCAPPRHWVWKKWFHAVEFAVAGAVTKFVFFYSSHRSYERVVFSHIYTSTGIQQETNVAIDRCDPYASATDRVRQHRVECPSPPPGWSASNAE